MGSIVKIIDQVRAQGADLRVYKGKLQVRRKHILYPSLLREITEMKQDLVTFLEAQSRPMSLQPALTRKLLKTEPEDVLASLQEAPRKSLHYGRKKSYNKARNIQTSIKAFRKACQWILPRLRTLNQTGWDNKSLFKIGKLAHPVYWGIAWSSCWMQAEKIKLGKDGRIIFVILLPPSIGGEVKLVSYPPKAKGLRPV